MRTVNFDGIAYEEFDSIHEYLRIEKQRDWNSFFAGKSHSSRRGEGYGFNASSSFEEACDLLTNGWSEPLNKMRDAFNHKVRVNTTESRTKAQNRYNVMGHTPSVPRFIEGLPDAMVETIRQPMKSKTIHLMYDTVVAGSMSTEQMTKAGVAVLETVSYLERLGYRVKLTSVGAFVLKSEFGGRGVMGGIVMKEYRQPLDVKKLCFPVAHGDMSRRIFFGWQEKTPVLREYCNGYGHGTFNESPSERDKLQKALEAEGGFFICESMVRRANYDPETLMKQRGIAQTKGGK